MNSKTMNGLIEDLNRISKNRLHIISTAITTFSATRAGQAAASLAYYAIFSLFPLMLVFIIAGSYFLDSEQVFMRVMWSLQQVIPVSQDLISENLQHVLEERETVGILVLLGLLWSASNVFISLAYNINLAWPLAVERSFLHKRLLGLGMIVGLSLLLLLSILLDWLAHMIPIMDILNASFSDLGLLSLFSGFFSWLMVFLLFLALYRWIPTVRVRWDACFWGALVASVGWKLSTAGFAWYLKSGFGRYELIYGSLGAIVGLLFLVYLISMVTLFGAHLCAAIDLSEKQKTEPGAR